MCVIVWTFVERQETREVREGVAFEYELHTISNAACVIYSMRWIGVVGVVMPPSPSLALTRSLISLVSYGMHATTKLSKNRETQSVRKTKAIADIKISNNNVEAALSWQSHSMHRDTKDTCVFHLNLCTKITETRRVPYFIHWMNCMYFDPYKKRSKITLTRSYMLLPCNICACIHEWVYGDVFVLVLSSLWLERRHCCCF